MIYENQTFESVAEYIERTNKWQAEHSTKEQSFEEQLRIEHNSRIQRESWERHCKQVRGEYIYVNFCVWCNCYADNETKINVPAFKKWLKEQGIELTPYQSRYLLEHKFGYKVWYDEKEKDWRCEKVASTT